MGEKAKREGDVSRMKRSQKMSTVNRSRCQAWCQPHHYAVMIICRIGMIALQLNSE